MDGPFYIPAGGSQWGWGVVRVDMTDNRAKFNEYMKSTCVMYGAHNELNGALWCEWEYLYEREDGITYIAELIAGLQEFRPEGANIVN
ncbi:hypothetical protein EYZ11_011531 [Aspergillus tanneri]|uniref:Uncharacterized protein n=1 Tax=Aspergillus tanneri TaxID=1220188 RepID=A0A4S3J2X8_9EURO|nr:hypothetical protein EYZ11_011531 [Aspergillus tanneri]